MADGARGTAEAVARAAYGRLVAYLAARSRDVAAAEDALAEAFAAALRVWPETGVPERPEAWLFTAARRQLIQAGRRQAVRGAAEPTLALLAEERQDRAPDAFPDERLKLLFVCAHPAIDPAARAPLMLQTVLGLDAARIASAFLVAPAAMGQRLVRAKTRIREAGIAFAVPEPEELPERLAAVLDAIYAAYGSGWEDAAGTDARRKGLTAEAIWLARLVTALLPGEPEARGLLALMLYCEARAAARRDAARPLRAAVRAGRLALVARHDRRGRARTRRRRFPAPSRPLPARGRDPVRPHPAPDHRPHQLGGDRLPL